MSASVNISVIIPYYNDGDKIVRAYNSVLKQTNLPKEIIIVDDASSDKSYLYFLEQNHDSTIGIDLKIIFLEQNQGPSVARNIGVKNSTSEYVAFLDADDYWHIEKLKIQNEYIQRYSLDMLGSAVKVDLNVNQYIDTSIFQIEVVTFNNLLFKNYFSTPSVVMKKSIFTRFDSTQRYSEDYKLWLCIANNKCKCAYIDIPLVGLNKLHYGVSGLSSHMWKMEFYELKNFLYYLKKGKLLAGIAMLFSVVKFIRRLIICKLR